MMMQQADHRQRNTNLLHSTYSSLLFTSALATLFWPPTTSDRIVIRPRNTAAVVGSDVSLNCSVEDGTSAIGNFAHISWNIYTSKGSQTLSADRSNWPTDIQKRFNISARTMTSGTGLRLKTFDLRIHQLLEADAGLYSCNSGSNHFSAYLIVLGSTPACSSNLNGNFSDLVENETVHYRCSVKSFADPFETFPPHFRWTWLSFDDEHVTFENKSSVRTGAENVVEVAVKAQPFPSPTLSCYMYFEPSRSHVDTLPDPPLYKHHCEIDGWSNRTVLYPPRNVVINASSDGIYYESDVLVCRSDGLPKPALRWLLALEGDNSAESTTIIGEGDVLALRAFTGKNLTRLRCQASNVIRNRVRESTSKAIVVRMAVKSSPSSESTRGDGTEVVSGVISTAAITSSKVLSDTARETGNGTGNSPSSFVGVVAVVTSSLLLAVACVSSAIVISIRRNRWEKREDPSVRETSRTMSRTNAPAYSPPSFASTTQSEDVNIEEQSRQQCQFSSNLPPILPACNHNAPTVVGSRGTADDYSAASGYHIYEPISEDLNTANRGLIADSEMDSDIMTVRSTVSSKSKLIRTNSSPERSLYCPLLRDDVDDNEKTFLLPGQLQVIAADSIREDATSDIGQALVKIAFGKFDVNIVVNEKTNTTGSLEMRSATTAKSIRLPVDT